MIDKNFSMTLKYTYKSIYEGKEYVHSVYDFKLPELTEEKRQEYLKLEQEIGEYYALLML